MATFLVTSHGRSGTKWLARELNRSKVWTVDHESKDNPVGKRFWGNVDSYRRYQALGIEWSAIAVIYRDPMDIARSAYFKKPSRWDDFITALSGELWTLDRILRRQGVFKIDFKKMTTSPEYLDAVATRLGVVDLDKSAIDFTPTNSSPKGVLTMKQRDQVDESSAWFVRQWS